MKPIFIFNTSAGEDGPWQHVPAKVLPPRCSPTELQQAGLCMKQVEPLENLVRAALKRKTFFYNPEIENMMHSAGVPIPTSGSGKETGPGKEKRVLKIDLARALVHHHLADSFSDEEMEEISQRVCYRVPPKVDSDTSDSPESLLEMFGNIDIENAQHFKDIVQAALNKQKKKKESTAKTPGKVGENEEIPQEAASGSAAVEFVEVSEMPAAQPRSIPIPNPERVKPTVKSRMSTPEALVKLLPPRLGSGLVNLHWKPMKKQVQIRLDGDHMVGFQRTKQASWKLDTEKVQALSVVFSFLDTAYHTCFKKLPGYDKDWKRPTIEQLEAAVAEAQDD